MKQTLARYQSNDIDSEFERLTAEKTGALFVTLHREESFERLSLVLTLLQWIFQRKRSQMLCVRHNPTFIESFIQSFYLQCKERHFSVLEQSLKVLEMCLIGPRNTWLESCLTSPQSVRVELLPRKGKVKADPYIPPKPFEPLIANRYKLAFAALRGCAAADCDPKARVKLCLRVFGLLGSYIIVYGIDERDEFQVDEIIRAVECGIEDVRDSKSWWNSVQLKCVGLHLLREFRATRKCKNGLGELNLSNVVKLSPRIPNCRCRGMDDIIAVSYAKRVEGEFEFPSFSESHHPCQFHRILKKGYAVLFGVLYEFYDSMGDEPALLSSIVDLLSQDLPDEARLCAIQFLHLWVSSSDSLTRLNDHHIALIQSLRQHPLSNQFHIEDAQQQYIVRVQRSRLQPFRFQQATCKLMVEYITKASDLSDVVEVMIEMMRSKVQDYGFIFQQSYMLRSLLSGGVRNSLRSLLIDKLQGILEIALTLYAARKVQVPLMWPTRWSIQALLHTLICQASYESICQIFQSQNEQYSVVLEQDQRHHGSIGGYLSTVQPFESHQLFDTLLQLTCDARLVDINMEMIQVLMLHAIEYMFNGSGSSDREYMCEHLFQRFVQVMSEMIHLKLPNTVRLMLDVLFAVFKDSAESHLFQLQTLLRDCDIFVHLFTILHGSQVVLSLCNAVCDLFTLLMKNNDEAKLAFRQLMVSEYDLKDKMAYDPFRQALLIACGNQPSRTLFDALFGMMVDGCFDPDIQCRIENPDVVPVILSFLPLVSEELQGQILSTFDSIFTGQDYVLNQSLCCHVEPGVLDQLIGLMPDFSLHIQHQAVRLIQYLGTHCINVKQLKSLFRLMQYQLVPTTLLVSSVLEMAQRTEPGPARYFYFDGVHSGLKLPAIDMSSTGYAFSTWLYLENSSESTIYSFSSSPTEGFRLDLSDNVLSLYYNSQNINTTVRLQPRIWYCLGLSHSGPTYRSDAKLTLHIDGHIRWKGKVAYPTFTRRISTGCIATSGFHGRMGPIYVFSKNMPNRHLQELFALGPDYTFAFESASRISGSPQPSSDLVSFLVSSVHFSYHSSVWEGEYFLNNSAAAGSKARRLKGTYDITTRNIRDVLDCIGGVSVIFPLFAQCDTNYTLLPNLLHLIRVLTEDNGNNQQFIKSYDGIRVIGYLLTRLPRLNMTMKTLDAINQFIASLVWSTRLVSLAVETFLLDTKLWSLSSSSVQAAVDDSIQHFITLKKVQLFMPQILDQDHMSLMSFAQDATSVSGILSLVRYLIASDPTTRKNYSALEFLTDIVSPRVVYYLSHAAQMIDDSFSGFDVLVALLSSQTDSYELELLSIRLLNQITCMEDYNEPILHDDSHDQSFPVDDAAPFSPTNTFASFVSTVTTFETSNAVPLGEWTESSIENPQLLYRIIVQQIRHVSNTELVHLLMDSAIGTTKRIVNCHVLSAIFAVLRDSVHTICFEILETFRMLCESPENCRNILEHVTDWQVLLLDIDHEGIIPLFTQLHLFSIRQIDGWRLISTSFSLATKSKIRFKLIQSLVLKLTHEASNGTWRRMADTFSSYRMRWQTEQEKTIRMNWECLFHNLWHLILTIEFYQMCPMLVLNLIEETGLENWTEFKFNDSYMKADSLIQRNCPKGGMVRVVIHLLLRNLGDHQALDRLKRIMNSNEIYLRSCGQRVVYALVSELRQSVHRTDLVAVLSDLLENIRIQSILKLNLLTGSRTGCGPTEDPLLQMLNQKLQLEFDWDSWDSQQFSQTQLKIWRKDMIQLTQILSAKKRYNSVHIELLCQQSKKESTSKVREMVLKQEHLRQKKMTRAMQQERRSAATNWQRILRSLMNERGPWGKTSSASALAGTDHWKLDRSETSLRERLKLKRKYITYREQCVPKKVRQLMIPDETAQLTLANDLIQAKALAVVLLEDREDETVFDDDFPLDKCTKLNCEIVVPLTVSRGVLTLFPSYLVFKSTEEEGDGIENSSKDDLNQLLPKPRNKKIKFHEIQSIRNRMYQFQHTALELFLLDGTSVFINFTQREHCSFVENVIRRIDPPRLQRSLGKRPEAVFKATEQTMTTRWVNGEISNFEYLMHLNTVAGRTYNDLAQYPIFPWILRDYSSSTLDLSDPNVYRDLTRPMGVQNDSRVDYFQQRYQSLAETADELPPFHHGTHYSCAGFVIGYMIRIEPFASLHKHLQGGRFDHADRLFYSLHDTYQSCSTNPSDVRELIPEFFCFPEFLSNLNRFDLGTRQNGQRVDHVHLPPWAESPDEFIRLHRLALESDYVSEHLHHWIDLVFGYKQQGQEAIDACNVFFHLTYEGAVDLAKLKTTDPELYKTTLIQLDSYGQTPAQLLRKPHPARQKNSTEVLPMFSTCRSDQRFVTYPLIRINSRAVAIVSIAERNNRLITIDSTRRVQLHKWKALDPDVTPPFTIFPDRNDQATRVVGAPFATWMKSSWMFAVHPIQPWIFTCSHWDHGIRVTRFDEEDFSTTCVQTVFYHQDVVTCLALTEKGEFLITGSADTTVAIWKVSLSVDPVPVHTVFGHDDIVTCVAASMNFDIICSCSQDTTILVHSLHRGQYVRSISCPDPLSWCGISPVAGQIVGYSEAGTMLLSFSINGTPLGTRRVDEKLQAFAFSQDGSALVVGGRSGRIRVYRLYDMICLDTFGSSSVPIHSLAITNGEMHLLVGLATGSIRIYTLNADYLRQRLQRKLADLGF